tara:strand:+ start:220 stop:702 length:483 start_codon:yes stop_codon:yes gene_type:complete
MRVAAAEAVAPHVLTDPLYGGLFLWYFINSPSRTVEIMDEFSWFVGLYEGEGTFGSRVWTKKDKKSGKVYKGVELSLVIKMTDEDTIKRAGEFVGVSYALTDRKYTAKMGRKPIYRMVKNGGLNGSLRDLLNRMYPHLSKRRQKQIDDKLEKARLLKEAL